MCGVLGWSGEPDAMPGEARWARAMKILRPRGPDGEGDWTDSNGRVRLGHTRLAIQDPTPAGAQPMACASGRFTVSYNGEIYNAPKIRERLCQRGARLASTCDTEVLVEAIDAWGFVAALGAIRGMFAIICWDRDRGEMLGAVDHVSMKPLAFGATSDAIVLGSTADSVRAVTGASALDPTAMGHLLCLGYCPAPTTMWRGIAKLGPGQMLRWSAGDGALVETWWRPPSEISNGPVDGDEFGEILDRVCGRHLLSDVPVGVLLSGGLDSSAVALGAVRAGGRPTCVTLAMHGDDDESLAAGETASYMGLRHHRRAMLAHDAESLLHDAAAAYDEPQGYGALLTATAVSAVAREQTKVMLSGDGGDEALAGYTWHASEPGTDQPPARVSGQDRWLGAYLQSVYPRFTPGEAASLLRPVESDYRTDAYLRGAREADVSDLPWPRRAQRIDLLTFCAGSILPKVDRAAMARGLEIRMPLLDRDVLEWSLSRPVVAGEPPKDPIRRYLHGSVPDALLGRRKQGFSLRLGETWSWRSMMDWLRESRLMRSGAIADGWEDMLCPDRPYAEAKTFAFCMLAAWGEGRL